MDEGDAEGGKDWKVGDHRRFQQLVADSVMWTHYGLTALPVSELKTAVSQVTHR